MATHRRISLLISTMGCGGAERVAALLAGGLQADGYEVSVLTLSGPREPFYPLAGGVRLVPLGVMGESRSRAEALAGNARRIRALARALRELEPDVLVSFITENNVLAILASRVFSHLPCRTVISEHNYPRRQDLGKPWRLARRLTYPLADALVTCSSGLGSWFGRWLPKHKVFPIQNPVLFGKRRAGPSVGGLPQRMARQRWILGMGRLDPQKGFDLLLEAFAHLPPSARVGWRLGIIGEGSQRDELERLIQRLGLEQDASLLGRFANPIPLLRAGKIFAFSSRWEGFGIALAEAMACGLAAVAFDCDYGPREIIRDGLDGLLVPPGDVKALAEALRRLMQDLRLRRRLASRAPEVLNRFSERRFLARWESVLDSLPTA